MFLRHIQDYLQIVTTLLIGIGGLLLVGRPTQVARVVLASLIVASIWAAIGGFSPSNVWSVGDLTTPTLIIEGYLSFHWLNAILAGVFGAGMYLYADLSTAFFEGKGDRIIKEGSLSSAALMVGLFATIALAFAVIFWIVLYTMVQSLLAIYLPQIEPEVARILFCLAITIPAGLLLGRFVRLITNVGAATRGLTARQARAVGIALTVLGTVIAILSPSIDLYFAK